MAERFCSGFVLATEGVDTPTPEGARANLGQNIQPEAAKRTVVQTATLDTGRIPQGYQQATCKKERTGEISGLGRYRVDLHRPSRPPPARAANTKRPGLAGAFFALISMLLEFEFQVYTPAPAQQA